MSDNPKRPPTPAPLLKPADVAARLGVSRSAAYERMRRMRHFKDGAILRVSEEDFKAYVRRHTKPPETWWQIPRTDVDALFRQVVPRMKPRAQDADRDRFTRPIVKRTKPVADAGEKPSSPVAGRPDQRAPEPPRTPSRHTIHRTRPLAETNVERQTRPIVPRTKPREG